MNVLSNAPARVPYQRRYVGIAGITSREEHDALVGFYSGLRDRYSASTQHAIPDLSLGVLISSSDLLGSERARQPLRYASASRAIAIGPSAYENDPLSYVREHVWTTLHYAPNRSGAFDGRWARELAAAAPPYASAVQINVRDETIEPDVLTLILRRAAASFRAHRLIVQIPPVTTRAFLAADGLSRDAFAYGVAIGIGREATDILVDASGGTGAAISSPARALALCRALRAHGCPNIGYAGGLSPDNLDEYRELLADGFSIDAESALRDDAEGGGHLVLDRACAYLEKAIAIAVGDRKGA